MKSIGNPLGAGLLILASFHLIAFSGQAAPAGTAVLVDVSSNSKTVPLRRNPALPVPTESQQLALEAAEPFLKDGFRIRDGEWSDSLTTEVPIFLSVTLFEGERYWFAGASPTRGALLRLTVYDSEGRPMATELLKDGAQGVGVRCATGIAPRKSGRYFLSMELIGNPTRMPVDFSVVYAYK